MRLVFINLWRVNNAFGGTEKVFFNFANGLVHRGHQIKLICSDCNPGEPKFEYDPVVQFCNCRVDVPKWYLKLRSFYLTIHIKRKLKRQMLSLEYKSTSIYDQIQNFQPDIIVSFQHETTYMLNGILNIKTPIITMFHGKPSCYFDEPIFELSKKSLEKCACCQVLMPEFIPEVKKYLLPKRIEVIPNVVPQFNIFPDYNFKKIIHVGRIDVEKRQNLVIEAFALIKDHFPDWEIEFWGETDVNQNYTSELNSLILKNGLKDRVKLCGRTTDISSKLLAASIFIFPSANEGFPLALTEAMSIGLPAIGCKSCSAVNTLIRDSQNGFLCNDNPLDISKKLAELMLDSRLRGKFGRQAKLDMKKYSENEILDTWEKLFYSILNTEINN